MELRYTYADYLAATQIRTRHTIVVEGQTDRVFIASLLSSLHDAGLINAGHFLIDTSDSVEAPQPGMGARAVVEWLCTEVHSKGLSINGFVDREWRQFDDASTPPADSIGKHHSPTSFLHWTRGHSVENYVFEASLVARHIAIQFPDSVDPDVRNSLGDLLPAALRASCAVSVALRNAGLLTRSHGLFTLDCWSVQELSTTKKLSITLNLVSVKTRLQSRGVIQADATTVVGMVDQLLQSWENTADTPLFRWLAHGHVAYEGVWSAVGAAVALRTGDPALGESVGHGHKDSRWKSLAHAWASTYQHGDDSFPCTFVDALCAATK